MYIHVPAELVFYNFRYWISDSIPDVSNWVGQELSFKINNPDCFCYGKIADLFVVVQLQDAAIHWAAVEALFFQQSLHVRIVIRIFSISTFEGGF